jgi:hypothetical protein
MARLRMRRALADQIDHRPTAVALLHVGEGQRGDLRAAQAAAEQQRQDGAVAQPQAGPDVRGIQQRLGLVGGEPVPGPDATRLNAAGGRDGRGGRGVEVAVGGGRVGQGADGRQALVDGGRRQAALEQVGAVALDGGPAERAAARARVPGQNSRMARG